MQVTDVRVTKTQSEGVGKAKVKALASVTLDGEFAVHGIKVLEGEASNFISFPSRRMANGEYKDIAHPINSETREKIQDAILEAYNNLD